MGTKNILNLTTQLAFLAVFIYIISLLGINTIAKSGLELELIWKSDIIALKESHKLPKFWNDIRVVEKICGPNDKIANKWIKSVSSPIEISPNGKFKLEILFVSDVDNNKNLAIIRHHIIEIASGNSVWELSRTYTLE